MKKISFLFFFIAAGLELHAQEKTDTLRIQVYDPLGEPAGYSAGLPDEEDDSGWFLPAMTGNGNYLPIGQLARNLIGVRFRPRGMDNRWQVYEVNGAELSDPTDGFPYWNILSGVQGMPNVRYDVPGLSPGRSGLGGAGGITSLSTTDIYVPNNNRISYARTNRSYSDRVTASAGGRFGDWMIRAGAGYRGGKDGYVTGMDSRRFSYSLSAGRRIKGHSLNLLAVFYRSDQGVRSAATEEVYGLAGDHYYNPNWGYQEGKVRNSKRREYSQGMGILSYEGDLKKGWKLNAAFSCFIGENSFSQLAWYDAPTPYPDYYRYLPGFFANQETGGALAEGWHSGDPSITQIDWKKLYEANKYNLDPNGIPRSHYIVRDLVTEKQNIGLSVSFEYAGLKNVSLRGGFRIRSDYSANYTRLNDLLGGSYWMDIDQYLLDDEYYGGMYQNDLRNPDRPVIASGERMGYHYGIRSNTLKAWGLAEYKTFRWRLFAGLEAGKITFQRGGKYEKEMFPGSLSFGKSERLDFPEYLFKAGAFYHFTLRSRIGLQAMAGQQAPLVKSVFTAPSYRNETLPDHPAVRVSGIEMVYQWNTPRILLDVAGYATRLKDENEIRNYYDDVEGEYLNLAMTGIDKIYAGVEIGVEWNATPRFSVLGVLSANVYKYDSDPSVALYRDSDSKKLLSGSTAYLAGYRLPGTPQTAGMLQLNYRTRSYWRFELSGKYTAQNYVSMNPVRRMDRALDQAGSPEIRREMTKQERLDDAFLLSLSVSKSFRFRNGDRIGLWVNVDNLLDDRSVRYSGYEQGRFSKTSEGAGRTLRPFPSKYYYAYGINYYAMISYTF